MYSIGEISKMFGLPISTLRYYDKEGLLPHIRRGPSGVRRFDESDIDTLRMVECLKSTGMQLCDIQTFITWCGEGDATLEQRRAMILDRQREVQAQIAALDETLALIRFKRWYYETAVQAGTEQAVRTLPPAQMPPEIRALYLRTHACAGCGAGAADSAAAGGQMPEEKRAGGAGTPA